MYLKYFNLKTKPFEICPDPTFLWLGEKHKEGLASLKYGILRSKGFMALTGDVGTGKTTLLNALAQSFDKNYIFARIPDPYLEELDFINFAASAFEMDKQFLGKGDFLSELTIFLNKAHIENKEVILVVDEAQRITPKLLEDVRLISNIEKPEKKLINIIFSGQPNFNKILHNNNALRSRLAIYYNIDPLTESETEAYIAHRLGVAGSDSPIFSSSAIHEIYSLANGIPRQINIICDLSLLHAYSAEKVKIGAGLVKECSKRALIPAAEPEIMVEYLNGRTVAPLNPNRNKPSRVWRRLWYSSFNGIRAALSRYKVAYLAPVPLIILISLIGILFYPDSFFSSVTKFKLQVRQTVNRLIDPVSDDASYQAQVVNVLTPTSSDSKQEVSAASLESAKNRNLELSGELAAQADLIADLQKKLEKAGSEITKLKKHLHINRQATALLKTQAKEISALKASSDAQLEELQTANKALTADLEELQTTKEQIAILSDRLTIKDGQLAQSKQRQQDLETELAQSKTTNDQLNDELLARNTRVAELQKKLVTARDAQSVLEEELKIERLALEQLQAQLTDANVQKTSSETHLAKLQTAHDALVVELEVLRRLQAETSKLRQALDLKDDMFSQRNQELEELKNKLARVQNSKDNLDGELSAQSAVVAELQKELTAVGDAKIALENQLLTSRREIELLQTQLIEDNGKESSSAEKLANLQTAHIALLADFEELKSAKIEAAELKNTLAEKEQLLTQSEQRHQDMKTVLARTQKSNAELKAELSAQASSVAELQQKLKAARAEEAAGEKQLLKSRQETVLLQARVKELETQKASSESQVDYLRTAHTALTADSEEIKEGREKIAELEHAVSIKDQIIDQRKRQLEALEREIVESQASKNKLEGHLLQQTALVTDLRKHLSDAKTVQGDLEGQLNEKRQEMKETEIQIKALSSQKTSASDRLANLQTAHEALKIKFEKLKNTNIKAAELENELSAKDQKLMQSSQRQQSLETDLSRSRKQEAYLKNQISSQAALIAELQDELATVRAKQASEKLQLQKSRQESVLLQERLNELKRKDALRASNPQNYQNQTNARSEGRLRKVEAEAPNPTDIIDFVIKKKSD